MLLYNHWFTIFFYNKAAFTPGHVLNIGRVHSVTFMKEINVSVIQQQKQHVMLDSEFNHKAISWMKNGRKHLNQIIICSIIISFNMDISIYFLELFSWLLSTWIKTPNNNKLLFRKLFAISHSPHFSQVITRYVLTSHVPQGCCFRVTSGIRQGFGSTYF